MVVVVVEDFELVKMFLVVCGQEFEVVGHLSSTTSGGVLEDVHGSDEPFPGAHLVTNFLVEVLGDDLEVPEEERSIARLVIHDNLAVLVVFQDVVQVCRVVHT